MNLKPKHTEPSTNSYAAAYGYDGFGGSAQARQGASRRRTLSELGSSSWISDSTGFAYAEQSRRIDQCTNHDIRFIPKVFRIITKEEVSKIKLLGADSLNFFKNKQDMKQTGISNLEHVPTTVKYAFNRKIF